MKQRNILRRLRVSTAFEMTSIKSVLTVLLITALLLTGSWSPTKASATPQVLIGSGTAPRAGAMLDLNSTTRGLLLPTIDLATSDITPSEGMMVYNRNDAFGTGKGVYVWSGTEWKQLTAGPDSLVFDPDMILYTTIDTQLPLTLVILPEQFQTTPVTWDSENKAVATVDDNGVVTTLTNGTTTITATAVINGKVATCSVEVRVPVSGLTVNPELVTFTTLGVQATVPYAVVEPETAHNTDVTWSSSNETVATVDPITGVITTLDSGNTNIIATSAADNTKSDYCAVTVSIPPASIALNSTVTFTAASTGGSTTRYATVSPAQAANRNVSWSSSNTGVATVSPATTASGSNATITLVNRGSACGIAAASATIYARSAANSGIVASFTATSNGTAACPPPVSGITLSSTATYAAPYTGGSTTRYATVSPSNASNTNVTWSSSNTAVATVSTSSSASGTIITITVPAASVGAAAGSATITAKASANTAYSASFTVTRAAYPACNGTRQSNYCWSSTQRTVDWNARTCNGEPNFVLPTYSMLLNACNAKVAGFHYNPEDLVNLMYATNNVSTTTQYYVTFNECTYNSRPYDTLLTLVRVRCVRVD